jgi:hypothetical protein
MWLSDELHAPATTASLYIGSGLDAPEDRSGGEEKQPWPPPGTEPWSFIPLAAILVTEPDFSDWSWLI